MSKIIGITGVARSGKDSFAKGLIYCLGDYFPNLSVKRYAFADPLKRELEDFFTQTFNISCVGMPDDVKAIYRPFLIAHGKVRRALSNNTYWVNLLRDRLRTENPDVAVITDLRYIAGENSEFDWVKSQGGLVVHVERYEETIQEISGITKNTVRKKCKIYTEPASDDEALNDPLLKEAADHRVSWPSIGDDKIESVAERYAEEFILLNINAFTKHG